MGSPYDHIINKGIAKYQHRDLVRRDIGNLTRQYKDLRPRMDSFVFNDGQRKELLQLEGTIPVPYKGNTYNIPICLYLLEGHPYNPPMVFVKPTSTMQIKHGKHVDTNGRVYLPYLTDWHHPDSDLFGLVQIMVIIFGEECPVFSRIQPQQSRPPYPPVGGGSGPGRPPYPQGDFMPMPSVGGVQPGGQRGYPRPGYSQPNPYPRYPPSTYGGSSYPVPYPPSTSSSSYPYPATHQQAPYPQSGYRAQDSTQTSASQRPLQSTPSLSEEQIKASVLSAVEDKMRRRLKEIEGQSKAEMDCLKKTQDDLNKGKAKLEDLVRRLECEKVEVENNVQILKAKNKEIREALETMENQSEFDIDEAVVPTAPLYKQILNSFAEEQAIEDAIYYLSEALRREIIDLDVFLKQVRELSRKQFMLRALITKCRQKAGLPEVVST